MVWPSKYGTKLRYYWEHLRETHWELGEPGENTLAPPKKHAKSLLIGCMEFSISKTVCHHFQPRQISPIINWGGYFLIDVGR